MRYTQITDNQVEQMLSAIGVPSVDSLFSTVPPSLRLRDPLSLPLGLSEPEMLRDLESLSARNKACHELVCFLGAGAYDHFIPTVVDAISSQSEFLTAYTPYQAEASQGILQLFYEFQTMVTQLTGMEVANASLYEGATAAAEAVSMATRITGRKRAIVAETVHPDTRHVLDTYAKERGIEISLAKTEDGVLDPTSLEKTIDDNTAAVVVQSPNFFGCLERLDQLIPTLHTHGCLAIVSADPLASGLLKPPGALGADIVVAEGQPLGIALQYGGPYLGLLACREKHLRKMPGRVVGATRDADGRRGFCLALQTREQHIKRERATSNICTNQGLLAIRASVYMAAMGQRGIAEVASQCFDKAHYVAKKIASLPGFELRFNAPFFKEFAVRSSWNVKDLLASCRRQGLLAGVPLARFDERYSDCFLVAVTERRTKEEMDMLVDALRKT